VRIGKTTKEHREVPDPDEEPIAIPEPQEQPEEEPVLVP
jgi:hypothetical protein